MLNDDHRSPHTLIRTILAGLTVSGAVLLAGCGNSEEIAEPVLQTVEPSEAKDGDAASSTTVSTIVETVEDEAEREEEPKDNKDHKDCDADPASPEIHKATAEVNEKYPNGTGGGWVFTGHTNYDTCSDLSFALVTQAKQGNAQFGTLILMFHKGEYLGIDSTYPQQAMEITPNDDGSFTVLYKDWEALYESGKAHAEAPNYNSTVTYYWDGSKVAHEGRIPNTNL